MSIKTAMFSNGTVVAIENGKKRKATKQEVMRHIANNQTDEKVVAYLSSQLPKKDKDGRELFAVKFIAEAGAVRGLYVGADKKDKKAYQKNIFAQTAPAKQTEPLNSGDKADPSLNVPRDEKKAKPEIDVGRDDVDNPDKVREEKYERGKGGDDLHNSNVPRSKSDGGLKGGNVAETSEETANDATSGNPDKYVQEFTPGKKPTPVGKDNRGSAGPSTASADEETKTAASGCGGSYPDEDTEMKSKKDKDDEKDTERDEKSEGKKKGKNLPPWLQNSKDDKDSDSADEDKKKEKKESQTESQLRAALRSLKEENEKLSAQASDLDESVKKYQKEINRYKIREARVNKAVIYALALRDLNPDKYAKGEDFIKRVEATVKTMPVDTIETAIAEIEQIRQEKFEAMQSVREASLKAASKDDSLNSAIVIPGGNYDEDSGNDLKTALTQGTTLGKFMAQAEKYEQERYG